MAVDQAVAADELSLSGAFACRSRKGDWKGGVATVQTQCERLQEEAGPEEPLGTWD